MFGDTIVNLAMFNFITNNTLHIWYYPNILQYLDCNDEMFWQRQRTTFDNNLHLVTKVLKSYDMNLLPVKKVLGCNMIKIVQTVRRFNSDKNIIMESSLNISRYTS